MVEEDAGLYLEKSYYFLHEIFLYSTLELTQQSH